MKDDKKKDVKQEEVDDSEDTKDLVLTDEFNTDDLIALGDLQS